MSGLVTKGTLTSKPSTTNGVNITNGANMSLFDSTFIGSTSAFPVGVTKKVTAKELAERSRPKICKRMFPKNTMIGEYLRHGIYLLYYKKEVVYVGQSMCPYNRIFQHKNQKLFDEFRILHCSPKRALYWEAKFIDYYQPQLNKTKKNKIDVNKG
tara:strand:- start:176 stop:640 length:465 start_codon:yes stop_codon:yes gene_type:complete